MDEFLKKYSYKKLDPEKRAKIKKMIFSKGNSESLAEKLWLNRYFKLSVAAAFLCLIIINVFIAKSFQIKEIKEYGACADLECKIENIRIAESAGLSINMGGRKI